jgi:cyanophycin synthetase
MFKVMRSQVDVVLPEGAAVLNAADPRIAEMAELCDGEVIFYSADPKAPAIAAHCAKGGRALFLRQDQVVLATGASEAFLPGLGKLKPPGANAAAAEDACWPPWAPPGRWACRST